MFWPAWVGLLSGVGGVTEHFSYIIAVVTINSIGEGKLIPSTGQARFRTTYTAIVMKPFKGEVVDAKVTNVSKVSHEYHAESSI